MRAAVRQQLLSINRAFYQSLAVPFASTRRRLQPGARRVIDRIEHEAAVLDVGCGHGLAAEHLRQLGFHGMYLGIDSSQPLIDIARRRIEAPWATFIVADAANDGWPPPATFQWILVLAVLHHIPGAAERSALILRLKALLHVGGTVAVSVWDIPEVERFRRKTVPWETVGLSPSDVEPGDVLIDWRQGGRGLRYVHRFTSEELERLAKEAGLTVVEEFRSDGEDGRMGLYQAWKEEPPAPRPPPNRGASRRDGPRAWLGRFSLFGDGEARRDLVSRQPGRPIGMFRSRGQVAPRAGHDRGHFEVVE